MLALAFAAGTVSDMRGSKMAGATLVPCVLVLGVLGVVACSSDDALTGKTTATSTPEPTSTTPTTTGQPEFIHHDPPNLAVSLEDFSDDALAADFGCTEIPAPSNLLGGLEPSYPIAVCALQYVPGEATEELEQEIASEQYFYYTGGLFGSYIRYLVYRDGEYMLLKTEEDLRSVFAPIESPDEALSYTLATRNLSAFYGLRYDPAYEYETSVIEDTYVSSDTGGYLVHLFHDQVFGCGPHWISEVDVHVSIDGTLEVRSSRQLFRDPALDDVCVD